MESQNSRNPVPYIPDNAPFTAEQRAYLNGFLAGLFSRTATDLNSATPSPSKTVAPLSILFGSQTGNAETLAKRVAKEAGQRGFAPSVFDMAQYPSANLKAEKNILVITSTYGDGDPPDNAKTFWESLNSDRAPAISIASFSVLALGDSNYPKFCEFGKNIDRRLEQLGARRIHPRTDCDVDFETSFRDWLDGVWKALSDPKKSATLREVSLPDTPGCPAIIDSNRHQPEANAKANGFVGEHDGSENRPANKYSRSNPLAALLLTNRKLNGPGSNKDTRHIEISLAESGMNYQAGDALGVLPSNCPRLVQEILTALGFSGDESVPQHEKNAQVPLREALLRHYEITRISQTFLKAVAAKTDDAVLKELTAPNVNGELTEFLWGREVIDLLLQFPDATFEPVEFVGLLKKLQPRLYSISSSPLVHAGHVHLTVGVVRYDSLGRQRHGVCSSFLADRAGQGSPVPVFVHENKHFRPPSDPSRTIIAVGPGTGIAPFRGFFNERKAAGASGKNWLFFGDQHEATDFLYRDELEAMVREGTISRLDTAFSRDQSGKIYVQNRMIENARELFEWLENGAHFYVCGDAKRMAKDVDAALHRVIELGGGRTSEQAAEYIARLKSAKRYQRDVY